MKGLRKVDRARAQVASWPVPGRFEAEEEGKKRRSDSRSSTGRARRTRLDKIRRKADEWAGMNPYEGEAKEDQAAARGRAKGKTQQRKQQKPGK